MKRTNTDKWVESAQQGVECQHPADQTRHVEGGHRRQQVNAQRHRRSLDGGAQQLYNRLFVEK